MARDDTIADTWFNGMSGLSLKEELLTLFHDTFGQGDPPLLSGAPGRVNIIGAHVDYNSGPVFPIPLDRGTVCAIRPRNDRSIGLVSRDQEGGGTYDLDDLNPSNVEGWVRYPLGMAWLLGQDDLPLRGFDLAVAGDLDIGAGLSSSASLLVACARGLSRTFELGLTPEDEAVAAYRAENEFVGVSCGLMDPMAAALARTDHGLFLDCRDRSYHHVPIDTERIGVVVIDSATRRSLAESLFNDRVAECHRSVDVLQRIRPEIESLRDATLDDVLDARKELGEVCYRRARHVVEEIARVFAFSESLEKGDLATCGQLVTASHNSLRELYETSTDALDFLVDASCREQGVLGARLTGAGWGGCVLVLVERGSEARLVEAVGPAYKKAFDRDAIFHVVGPFQG